DVFQRRDFLGSVEGALLDAVDFRIGFDQGGGESQLSQADAGGCGRARDGGACEELSAVQVQILRGNVVWGNIGGLFVEQLWSPYQRTMPHRSGFRVLYLFSSK